MFKNQRGFTYNKIETICLFMFIISRQTFRAIPEYSSIWPIFRLLFYVVVFFELLRRPVIHKNRFFRWAAMFLILSIVFSLFSPYFDNAFDRWCETALVFLDVAIVFVFCQYDNNRTELPFWALSISGIIIVILMLGNFDSHSIVNTGVNYLIQTRMSLSEYENPNITAYKLLFSLMSTCYLVQFKKINFKLGAAIILFLFAGMVLTGSRKTFLIMLPALAILFMGGKKKTLKIITVIILVYLSYYLVMNNAVLYNIIGWRLERTGDTDASSLERTELMIGAIKIGFSNFFGVGLHNYMYYTSQRLYAHNNFLEIFADLGIVGLVAYYSIAIGSIWDVIRYTKRQELKYWLVYIGVYLAVDFGQVSYNLFSGIIMIAMMCLIIGQRSVQYYNDSSESHNC